MDIRKVANNHISAMPQRRKFCSSAAAAAASSSSSSSHFLFPRDSRHLQADCQEPGSAPEP